MSRSQGLCGALDQYWTIDSAPRLHRKNTFFDDRQLSNHDALRFGLIVSVLATAIIIFWSIMGLML